MEVRINAERPIDICVPHSTWKDACRFATPDAAASWSQHAWTTTSGPRGDCGPSRVSSMSPTTTPKAKASRSPAKVVSPNDRTPPRKIAYGSPSSSPESFLQARGGGYFIPLLSEDEKMYHGARASPLASSFLTPPKVSLSPSHCTVTTVDSLDSIQSPISFGGSPLLIPLENRSSLSPSVRGSPAIRADEAKWVWGSIRPPPRDISVCHVIKNATVAHEKVSPPSSTSAKTHSKKSFFSGASKGDEQIRRSRLKTELCLHYTNKTICPFGNNCTYAHGEEELQLTKLIDLHRAGMVDIDTYRTKPCLTWVSTGSWYVCVHLIRVNCVVAMFDMR